ncbi:Fc.00g075240.m01.CDS01 [Cosmosporella sp. VM-42]
MSFRRDDIPDSTTGVLPVIPPGDGLPGRDPRSNAATAASAAGVRALSAQVVAFYFRAPAKAFFRTRVDYLAYARTVHQAQTKLMLDALAHDVSASKFSALLRQTWLLMRSTTPGVLTSAIRHQGWGIVPHQILPPLIANIGVGAVLYTSYLQILGRLHEESGQARKRVYPPPQPAHTFTAGLLAGGLQSVLAAPLDALQARYDHRDLMPNDGSGKPRSLWGFSAEKLREIGLRGIFAGWGLSLAKDSLGSAIFFSTFEYVKAQGYYRFVTWYYGGLEEDIVDVLAMKRPTPRNRQDGETIFIRPHYALEPMFLLFGGLSASLTQQVLLHPLTHFQVIHWDHLEELDAKAAKLRASAAANPDQPKRRWRMLRAYYRAYRESWAVCSSAAKAEGQSLSRWLYRGFWWNAIRQVPSTSAGLIIFELIRRKYGLGAEEVRINKDGYDILVN